MSSMENTVCLSIQSYNTMKAENTRFQMFISRLWESAELKSDYTGIQFNSELLNDLMHLVYPDQYKKKLATLRTQQTKLSMQKLNLQEPLEDNKDGN